MEIGALVLTYCGGGGQIFFFPIFVIPYHSHSMHISVFFFFQMVCTYSLLTMLYNYLQMNNQITIFMKKIILKY